MTFQIARVFENLQNEKKNHNSGEIFHKVKKYLFAKFTGLWQTRM